MDINNTTVTINLSWTDLKEFQEWINDKEKANKKYMDFDNKFKNICNMIETAIDINKVDGKDLVVIRDNNKLIETMKYIRYNYCPF